MKLGAELSTNNKEAPSGELTMGFLQKIIGRHRGVLIFGRKVIDDTYIRDHGALIAEVSRLNKEIDALKRRRPGRQSSDQV